MRKSGGIWGSKRWKPVTVGEEVLDTDEFGFVELEELEGAEIGNVMPSGKPMPEPAGEEEGLGDKDRAPSKADLRAQLRALMLEQKRVKARLAAASFKGAGVGDTEDDAEDVTTASPVADGTESDAKKQERARLRKEAAAARKAERRVAVAEKKKAAEAEKKKTASKRRAGPELPEAPTVDTSAWRELDLHPLLVDVVGRLGFSAPTPIQSGCIPAAARDRRDVIAAAQTGSGKTLAFGLPILQALLEEREAQKVAAELAGDESDDNSEDGDAAPKGGNNKAAPSTFAPTSKKLRALILAPTRELALQVTAHLEVFSKPAGVWVCPIVGGISALKQDRLLARGPEIVVATPGRLWDLMNMGERHLVDLSALSFLVLDEADRMVQNGHYGELGEILGRVEGALQARARVKGKTVVGGGAAAAKKKHATETGDAEQDADDENDSAGQAPSGARVPKQLRQRRLQTMVVSATLTLPAELRRRLKKGGGGSSGSATLESLMDRVPFGGSSRPAIVDLSPSTRLATAISEAHVACPEEQRDDYLYAVLSTHPGRALVFVNAVSAARRLAALLRLLGLPARPLHAGMQQRQRLAALDAFARDPAGVLVATDVAARGLDVRDVRAVVHYQLPASLDTYVHRSGRTARGEAEGLSLALVTPKDQARFLALYRALGKEPPPEFPVDLALLPAARKRVRLAVQVDSLERKRSKSAAEAAWRRQNACELDIDLSDDESGEENEGMATRRVGKKARREETGMQRGDPQVQAQKLRTELEALLAEPLQAQFSRRFFAGSASASLAAHRGGASVAENADEAPAGTSRELASATVGLAQALAASRRRGVSDTAKPAKTKAAKNKGPKSPAEIRAAALAAAVAKAAAGKKGRRRVLVVVPRGGPALGRATTGPDALHALRSATRQ